MYSSQLLSNAVNHISKLPGVGKKTALRYALSLLRQDREEVLAFAKSISDLRTEVHYCRVCNNICDTEVCEVCSNPRRDTSLICVVENIRDVMAIENTGTYKGLYHVLGGIISPIDGIAPHDIAIAPLLQRAAREDVKEVILALSGTMEGDTTCFYIYRKLENIDVQVTTIARGVSVDDELEYVDELTLSRSIQNRIMYNAEGVADSRRKT